jgi:hypothetical protein
MKRTISKISWMVFTFGAGLKKDVTHEIAVVIQRFSDVFRLRFPFSFKKY